MSHRPSAAALFSVGVTVLVLVGGLAVSAAFLMSRAKWADETLATIEPRHARLLGLAESAALIDAAGGEAMERLSALAHPAAVAADRVGADLQQRVRADAAAAGFSVVGSQILPVRELDGFEAVPVSVLLEGSLEHFAELADRVAAARPAIRVLGFNVTPLRGRGVTAARNLRVELTLASARLVR